MNNQTQKNLNILAKLDNSLSEKSQFQLIKDLVLVGLSGEEALLELLTNRQQKLEIPLSYLDMVIFEFLMNSKHLSVKESLSYSFPNGLVYLKPSLSINYQPLQNLLIMHRYQEADKLTQVYLCQLAGLDLDMNRDWLYFTDIPFLPSEDLMAIDSLWQTYSRKKFGFSKQRHIWLSSNGEWEKFWQQIGWKSNGIARRYPSEFAWNINAPAGHLPLFNQLRGAQVISALFNHMAWNK